MQWREKSRWKAGLVCLAIALAATVGAAETPRVVVVQSASWSQGDQAREGAAEFLLLMEIARLEQTGSRAGLVAVGDRRGLFSPGAEEALAHAVRAGLTVVKLAPGGRVLPPAHGLFLDGGKLTGEEARRVLTRCLQQYGPLPGPDGARRERLQLIQHELTLAASPRLATR